MPLGSAALLPTNEGGITYWRSLECVATCPVLEAPPSTPLGPLDAGPVSGVIELSGGGGTYHLQLHGQRAR